MLEQAGGERQRAFHASLPLRTQTQQVSQEKCEAAGHPPPRDRRERCLHNPVPCTRQTASRILQSRAAQSTLQPAT